MIVGTGLYAPGDPVLNDVFDRRFGRDVSTFLKTRRGISRRHFMADGDATSDLAAHAARAALAMADLKATDLDLVIVATDTPDYVSPATAAVVQHKLGARGAGSYDLNAACAGFVTALDAGAKAVAGDSSTRYVLVVGAYGISRHLDWNDYKTSSLFADGAGAVILAASDDEHGVLASCLRTDGQYHEHMGIYAGGTRWPCTGERLAAGAHHLCFRQRIPDDTNSRAWPELTRAVMDRVGAPVSSIDHFFMTQINIDSINATLTALQLPTSRSHNIMDRFAYTGSAAIPMAIADAVATKRLRRGDLAMLLSSGGGLAMAALALRWAFNS